VIGSTLTPAVSEVRILASPGGEATAFLNFFSVLDRSGERIVIDGPCLSACTLVLSTIPRARICVTPRAVLGFHAARRMDDQGRMYPAPEATRSVAASYPADVRAWIQQHGGLTAKPIFLRGRQLAALYPRCSYQTRSSMRLSGRMRRSPPHAAQPRRQGGNPRPGLMRLYHFAAIGTCPRLPLRRGRMPDLILLSTLGRSPTHQHRR
jgi:hypothetical protein